MRTRTARRGTNRESKDLPRTLFALPGVLGMAGLRWCMHGKLSQPHVLIRTLHESEAWHCKSLGSVD